MNMSPHFYIVYFIICINWSICDEYYEKYTDLERKAKESPEINSNQESTKRKKNTDAQFDLADFLNIADDISIGDGNFDYNVKSEHNADYSEYGFIDDNTAENLKKRDGTSDFINGAYQQVESNMKPLEVKKSVNDRQLNTAELNNKQKLINNRIYKAGTPTVLGGSVDQSLNHHPEKKCSFKNMKFPFFSHNKNQTSKKAKKRKMFCLNCKKEDTATTSTEPYDVKNKYKRSYVEKLCPECRRKFKSQVKENLDDGKRIFNERMIHNSRQYFAETDNRAKARLECLTKNYDIPNEIAISVQNPRRKREDSDDRYRRLQELDLIQKKVDNLEVKMPHYEKPVQMMNGRRDSFIYFP